ncbi:hypothetical protein [Sphingopyxis sp.]|uniref:hypothetical protein n=1 Tax=Sphingopyxis sp. TaxID=1908224 RepID=UPI003D80DFE7
MKHWDRRIVILGRLQAKPLLIGQLLCALALAGLIARQARGSSALEIVGSILFGNLLVTAGIAAAAFGLNHFHRMWRRRERWIFHDGAKLHSGGASWPLPLIRDVVIARNELGIASLRLVVDDDSEVTRELVKLYLLADRPEAVRQSVLFAVGGLRGFPGGSAMN